MAYYILSNPFSPRAATPATPVTLPTQPVTPPVGPTIPPNAPKASFTFSPISGVSVTTLTGAFTFYNLSVPSTVSPVSAQLIGSVKGLKANTVYTLMFCSQQPNCYSVGEVFNVTTDSSGALSINSTFSIPNVPNYLVYEVRLINGSGTDRERCNSSGLCSSTAFSIPGATITQAPKTPTPIPSVALLPDLVVKTISRDNQNYYHVQYCNNGKGSSAARFSISLYNKNTAKKFATQAVMSVPAPGSCTFTGGITCGLLGSNCNDNAVIEAYLDNNGAVTESNESNNSATQTFGSARATLTPVPSRTPTPKPTSYSVTIYAAGTPVRLVYPNMLVDLDGKQYYKTTVSRGNFSRRQFAAYTFTTPVITKPKVLTIRFNNDAYRPPQDINLYIDKVVINNVTYDLGSISVVTQGGHTPATGCNYGTKVTEMMACNGYMHILLK